uniref:Uncharacterized protein n=1 Tax=Anguilla anguilla TaxID=7936 RepID=A0A0E9XDW9_ANGAN
MSIQSRPLGNCSDRYGEGRDGSKTPIISYLCLLFVFFVLFFCEVFSDTAVLCRPRETDQLNLLFVCNLDACFCVTVCTSAVPALSYTERCETRTCENPFDTV